MTEAYDLPSLFLTTIEILFEHNLRSNNSHTNCECVTFFTNNGSKQNARTRHATNKSNSKGVSEVALPVITPTANYCMISQVCSKLMPPCLLLLVLDKCFPFFVFEK